jgi:acetylornithine deacetylase/succinyl-diaminopimelate desuccinylase-like protein
VLSEFFFEEASRWIGTDSVTSRSNAALLLRAETLLCSQGWGVRRQKVVERGVPFYNLLARRGPSSARPLLLNTHTDTVPPGPAERWTLTGRDPFLLTRRGRFLYGLGVADVKLNLLCQIEALRRLGPVPFRKPIAIAGTYGEERGLEGARQLIKAWRGPKPALVLDGEPTEMALIHRHRGYLVFEWRLPSGLPLKKAERLPAFDVFARGKSAHSSTPHLGVNALNLLLDWLQGQAARGFSPCVVSADGGTAHNQVPAEACFKVLMAERPRGTGLSVRPEAFSPKGPVRVLSWEVLFRLRDIAQALPPSHSFNWAMLRAEGPRWATRFDLRFPPEDSPDRLIRLVQSALRGIGTVRVVLNDPPLSAPKSGPEIRFLTKVLRESRLPVTLKEKLTCTEAGLYHEWGVPAVVVGPGLSTGNVHRPNERIAVAQLEAAVRFYETLFKAWQNHE